MFASTDKFSSYVHTYVFCTSEPITTTLEVSKDAVIYRLIRLSFDLDHLAAY